MRKRFDDIKLILNFKIYQDKFNSKKFSILFLINIRGLPYSDEHYNDARIFMTGGLKFMYCCLF